MRWKCFSLLLGVLAGLPAGLKGDGAGFLPQDLTMRVWGKQQGLPDNSVTAVLQTQDGYLWIGTSAGLARFDGVRFVPVAFRPGRSDAEIRVTTLCEDATGRLWIGTQENGLLYYFEGAVRRFLIDGIAPNETINGIASDAHGNLWCGTPSGVCCLSGRKLTRYTLKDGLLNDYVSSVNVARSGTVWISTRGGVCQFKNGRIIPFPFQTDNPGRNPESLGVYEDRSGNLWAFGDTYLVNLAGGKHLNHFGTGDTTSSTRIWSLCEGRHGQLWIGTSGKGLYCFADDKFFPVTLRGGELSSEVRALCEDREGNLWLGTCDSGLIRLQPLNVQVLDARTGLPNGSPACIALAPDGRAWVGFNPGGLHVGTAERFDAFTGETASDRQNLVSSICIAPDATLWIGSPGLGLYRVNNQQTVHYGTADGLSDNTILSVALDDSGTVWAGTLSGGLIRVMGGKIDTFGSRSGLRNQPITAILLTRDGGIWLGLQDGGVFRGEGGKFVSVVEPVAMGRRAIRAMHADAEGRIWIGAEGGRLACFVAGAVVKWDLNLGLSDSSIYGVLTGEEGDLWVSTGQSIYHILQQSLETSLSSQSLIRPQLVYEADAGASIGSACGWPRALKSRDGKLWFGMDSGVVTLDPERPLIGATSLPVVIETIRVNGGTLAGYNPKAAPVVTNHAPALARLPSDLRTLDIQFTALSFSAPEKVCFRHRLDGLDADWVNDGKERSVHYGRLPYGRYTFRVQAGNSDTWYENAATFSFRVPTPLWRTEWALTTYGIAGIVLVAGTARLVSHRRLRHRLAVLAAQRAMEQERMRIAQDMHDEIGSKLTKISFMSERAKGELQGQEAVAHKLDSIASTSRDLLQSLDEIVWAVNPHNDTLEHLAAYLGQYAAEYLQNTTVECELHIPHVLPHRPLSAETRHNLFLAFEEALNNALKHGKASRIRVEMRAERAQFEIRVADNGCGFDARRALSADATPGTQSGKRVGNGLRNLRGRLVAVGGECRIESFPGQGATVILRVPLRGATAEANLKRL
jgi:ligand-binding sensor domain-containing protein/signal transduction histidine kinase